MAIKTLGAALRHIDQLFIEGTASGLPDDQLLDRFLGRRDSAAFEALMARHGPMVLRVCRGVLRNPCDADDAFQATFLVLVKKARTIRGRANLAGWLHLVAYRVAIQANAAAARRRVQERRASEMAPSAWTHDPVIPDELIPALHEEIARLPEKIRLAVVLCELQGIPQAQAAQSLRLSERTLQRRLAEGRARLKDRLGRRGLECGGAVMTAVRLRDAGTVIPSAWREATLRAALDVLNSTVAAETVSAAAHSLTTEVLKTMFVQKLAIASAALLGASLLAWGASGALVVRGDEPKAAPPPVGRRAAPAPQPEPDPFDSVGAFRVAGRVLDPEGKPVENAGIFVRHLRRLNPTDPEAWKQGARVTTSDAEGRFHFDLDKAASDYPGNDNPAWNDAQIGAAATGFGPAWLTAGSLVKEGEATLRLAPDDVPIRGRIVDLQGRPVAGATAHALELHAVGDETDKDALLKSGAMDGPGSRYDGPAWLGQQGTWTTDEDGRFEIRGVGRDRIIRLEVRSPGMAKTVLYAMARTSREPAKPLARPTRPLPGRGSFPLPPLVGATFEVVLAPTKPITGVVRSKATGRPLAGFQVEASERSTGTEVFAVTDAEGRFRLEGLPKAESYMVNAFPRQGIEPFLATRVTLTDTEGLAPIETTLEVPKGVIVAGRIIDPATGRPVPAQIVQYFAVPGNPHAGVVGGLGAQFAVADGGFRMTVPPGEGMICAVVRGKDLPYSRARLRPADKGKGIGGPEDGETIQIPLGFFDVYQMIDIPADAESFPVELVLTRGETRKGKLVGPTGKPVTGAQCYGYGGTTRPWAPVKTLEGDEFEVFGLQASHPRLVAFAHRDLGLVGSIVIDDKVLKDGAPLVVRIERPGSIKGRLIDEDGLPLRGVSFMIRLEGPYGQAANRTGLWPDGVNWTSDSEGRFRIDGLQPGLKTTIDLSGRNRPGYLLNSGGVFREIVVRPGEVRDVGDVRVTVVHE